MALKLWLYLLSALKRRGQGLKISWILPSWVNWELIIETLLYSKLYKKNWQTIRKDEEIKTKLESLQTKRAILFSAHNQIINSQAILKVTYSLIKK